MTNVNFDPERFVPLINRTVALRENLKGRVRRAWAGGRCGRAGRFQAGNHPGRAGPQGEKVGIKSDTTADPDILALQWTLTFGLKGVAAYADHAQILGQEDESVYAFIHEGLAAS